MARLLYVFIALLLIISTPLVAKASRSAITNDLIIEKNAEMETLLKKRNPAETMTFLHEHISDDAKFRISFQNTSMPAEMQKNSLEMGKSDYINTFIQGLAYVDKYDVTIKTGDIKISDNGKTAQAEEVMIEEGVMLNPQNLLDKGIPFLSKTTCITTYAMEKGIIKSDKAACHTESGEISAI